MNYTVYELRDSESGSIDNENFESGEVLNVTKKYLIGLCPGGMGEVKDAIAAYLPRYWESPVGYWRRKGIAIKGVGKQCFECTGEYTTLVPATGGGGGGGSEDDSNFQFVPGSIAWDTTGATEHITSALSERVVGGDADNFEGAINVQGTSVQGIDKVVPALKYSETWIMPAQVGLSVDFVKAVYTLTGTVNASQFRAFAPGEALFVGARAQWSGDQPYTTVTFDFNARANNPLYYVKVFRRRRRRAGNTRGWSTRLLSLQPGFSFKSRGRLLSTRFTRRRIGRALGSLCRLRASGEREQKPRPPRLPPP